MKDFVFVKSEAAPQLLPAKTKVEFGSVVQRTLDVRKLKDCLWQFIEPAVPLKQLSLEQHNQDAAPSEQKQLGLEISSVLANLYDLEGTEDK